MKYLFLGCFFPDQLYPEIVKNSKGGVSNAADALQKSFVEGLSEVLDNLIVLNFPCIGMWPKSYRKIQFQEFNYTYVTYKGKKVECKNPSFFNLYMYSRYDIYVKIKNNIRAIAKQNDETLCVFVYAIMPWTMRACYEIKKRYGDRIRFVLIAPDLPEYQGVRKYYIQELLLAKRQHDYKTYYRAFDGFVFLTKYMADRIPVGNRPWTVVEGIFNLKDDNEVPVAHHNNLKTLFYSGTLNERFGILNLVEAFSRTSNQDFRLVLCGVGDTVDKIKEMAKRDNRILYLGLLSRADVLEKQKEATLLVNPRTFEGDFTKYSFPSKTMEYLASGVPTLIYSLPGIPEEYFSYCYHLEELGVNALQNKIEELLNLDDSLLEKMGARARAFVIENKNPYKQCARIEDLIKEWK